MDGEERTPSLVSRSTSAMDGDTEVRYAFYCTNVNLEGMIQGDPTGRLGMGQYGYSEFESILWGYPRYCQRGYLIITGKGIVFLGTIRRFDLPIPEPSDCDIRKNIGWDDIIDTKVIGPYLRIISIEDGEMEIFYLKDIMEEDEFYLSRKIRKVNITPNKLLELITTCMKER